MSSAFEQAAGIAAYKVNLGLRGLLFFLAMLWGAWVILGIVRHWRADIGRGDHDELQLYSRTLRAVIIVTVLWLLAYA